MKIVGKYTKKEWKNVYTFKKYSVVNGSGFLAIKKVCDSKIIKWNFYKKKAPS